MLFLHTYAFDTIRKRKLLGEEDKTLKRERTASGGQSHTCKWRCPGQATILEDTWIKTRNYRKIVFVLDFASNHKIMKLLNNLFLVNFRV